MVKRGCGGMDINEHGLLLMYREGVETYNGMWSNPGGTVEEGEKIVDAVIREHMEELGVKIKIINLLSYFLQIIHPSFKSRRY